MWKNYFTETSTWVQKYSSMVICAVVTLCGNMSSVSSLCGSFVIQSSSKATWSSLYWCVCQRAAENCWGVPEHDLHVQCRSITWRFECYSANSCELNTSLCECLWSMCCLLRVSSIVQVVFSWLHSCKSTDHLYKKHLQWGQSLHVFCVSCKFSNREWQWLQISKCQAEMV